MTKPDEIPRSVEVKELRPARSAGGEGSRSEETSGGLDSPVASFPHLKAVLSPSESGLVRDTVRDDGEIEEADGVIEGVRGACDAICPLCPIDDEVVGGLTNVTRL